MMRYYTFLLLLLLPCARPVKGELVLDAGNTTLNLANSSSESVLIAAEGSASDFLFWNLVFSIEPRDASTLGGLSVDSVTQPSSYVFGGGGDGIISLPAANNAVNASDFNGTFLGVAVGPSNLSLLQIEISVDTSVALTASGFFDVIATPGEDTGTFYTDSNFLALGFSNLPLAGGTESIGTVFVTTVPEPSTTAILVLGAVMSVGFLFRRRNRPH
jgi:hypothetical protein